VSQTSGPHTRRSPAARLARGLVAAGDVLMLGAHQATTRRGRRRRADRTQRRQRGGAPRAGRGSTSATIQRHVREIIIHRVEPGADAVVMIVGCVSRTPRSPTCRRRSRLAEAQLRELLIPPPRDPARTRDRARRTTPWALHDGGQMSSAVLRSAASRPAPQGCKCVPLPASAGRLVWEGAPPPGGQEHARAAAGAQRCCVCEVVGLCSCVRPGPLDVWLPGGTL
jgi:hypothetical protein